MFRWACLGLVALFILVGCGADKETHSKPRGPDTTGETADSNVARSDSATCKPRQAVGLIEKYFGAFNDGDESRISTLFPQKHMDPPMFGVGRGRDTNGSFGTYYRDKLVEFAAQRHRYGEKWRLLMVDVADSRQQGRSDIAYLVTREADDLVSRSNEVTLAHTNGIVYFGKGVIDCREQKILAWNMDAEMTPKDTDRTKFGVVKGKWPCPIPSNWKPGKPVVACAR